MNTQPRQSSPAREGGLQRAIVLQLLREDHPRRWSHAELVSELGAEESAVLAALRALHADGLVCEGPQEAWASRAALRLDELGLIAI